MNAVRRNSNVTTKRVGVGKKSLRRTDFAAALLIPLLLSVLLVAVAPLVVHAGIQERFIESKALKGNLMGEDPRRRLLIYLPPNYETEPGKRYPVVYLLHSYGAGPESWTGENGYEGMNIADVLNALISEGKIEPLIVVMPDAKTSLGGSWYTDSPASGNWETLIADELPAYIDSEFRTNSDRSHRGIAGQSMGGYGALRIAMHHPDTFGAVLGMSAVNLKNPDPFGAPVWKSILSTGDPFSGDAPLLARLMWSKAAAFSPDPDTPTRFSRLPYENAESPKRREDIWKKWMDNTLTTRVPSHAKGLARLSILLEVGNKDAARAEALAFAEALNEAGISYSMNVFEGGHVEGVRKRFESSVFQFFDQYFSGSQW